MNYAQILLALLMTLSLVLVGCQESTQVDTTQDVSSDAPKDTSAESVNETVAIETKDTKSESEQMDDSLAQAVADGTYTDEQEYLSPGGMEDIRVTLSVENDIIIDVQVEGFGELHRTSEKYINGVAAELPKLIIGKPITDMELPTQISGSSLTTAAFKESVEEIIDTY